MDRKINTVVHDLAEARDRHLSAEADRQALSPVERMKFAMSVMQYNQSFVNVTDGKANSLLLINSIFLATGAGSTLTKVLPLAAVVAASVAILLCLAVVFARLPVQMKRDRAKLVFFGHICQRRNKAAYREDFAKARTSEIDESLTGQVYDLARVVDSKFRAYRRAQLVTMLSAGLWITNLLAPAMALLQSVS
jgi:hypothetical protein